MTENTTPGVVCWDFDGTLAYHPGGWSGALATALRELDPGTSIGRDDIAALFHEGFPWHTPDVPHPGLSRPDVWWAGIEGLLARACVRLDVADGLAARVAHRTRALYTDPGRFALHADTLPALVAFRERGWRQLVVSNHMPELQSVVDGLGLGEYFHAVITSATTGYEKPHPEMYRHARAAAGGPRSPG